jgi:hypothetical protein
MEILQIVPGSLPDSVLAQDFVVSTAFAAPMDFGQILEEEAGVVEQHQQRSVMIGGKWVDAGFYVGEVLPEKNGHVRVNALNALVSEDKQISLTDPDARSMATSGKGSGIVGYNVQSAVDTTHHLIVAHEVTKRRAGSKPTVEHGRAGANGWQLAPNSPIFNALALYIAVRSRMDAVRANGQTPFAGRDRSAGRPRVGKVQGL